MESGLGTQTQIWRSLEDWPASVRPRGLWPYLAEDGSHGHTTLSEEDSALLGAKPEEAGYLRQVYLCGRERQPWVYARSLVAGPSESWLKDLGDQPLGDKVFSNPDAERSPILVAKIEPRHTLHKEAVARLSTQERQQAAQALWARRSRLSVDGAHILIYECFLPALSDA